MKLMATVLMAAVMAGGCSMVLQQRSGKTPGVACSNSRLYPAIDTIGGAIVMAAGAAALGYAWSKNHESFVLPSGGAVFAGWVGVSSGLSGYGMASACEQQSTGVATR